MANAYINILQPLSPEDLLYINVNKQLKATTVTPPNVATFVGASILNPSSANILPQTSISNFEFYINGQNVPSSLVNYIISNGDVIFTFTTSSIGYSLESDDEVIAIGKFV
jgi:hypothetical protein